MAPRGNILTEEFLNRAKYFEHIMDQDSFMPIKEGLHLLLQKPRQAYFYLDDVINGFEEFTCQVSLLALLWNI